MSSKRNGATILNTIHRDDARIPKAAFYGSTEMRHRFTFPHGLISEGQPVVFIKNWTWVSKKGDEVKAYLKGDILWLRTLRGKLVDLMFHDFDVAVRDVPKNVLEAA